MPAMNSQRAYDGDMSRMSRDGADTSTRLNMVHKGTLMPAESQAVLPMLRPLETLNDINR